MCCSLLSHIFELGKMRENQFHKMASKVFEKLQGYFDLTTDQGIINIMLEHFPEKLLNLPQQFNFLRGSCNYLTENDAENMKPISVIHGTGKIFHHNNGLMWTISEIIVKLEKLFLSITNIDMTILDVRPLPAVIYPCMFQSFQEIDVAKILHGSQNLTQIFQEKLGLRSGLSYDPCKIVLPQLYSRFSKLVK